MENKTDIQSVIFLDEYPKVERYAFLKRHKLSPIKKCITELIPELFLQNQSSNSFNSIAKSYCIIEPDEFKKLRTHRIKAYSNDGHIRWVDMIIGEY